MSSADRLRLVLVAPPSVLGKEVKRRLAAASLPWRETVLADFDPLDEAGGRRLSEYRGEAQVVNDAADLQLGPDDLAVLFGDAARSGGLLEKAAAARACIDLTGGSRRLESVPWAHYRVQSEETFPVRGVIGAPQPASATLASTARRGPRCWRSLGRWARGSSGSGRSPIASATVLRRMWCG